MILFVGVYYLLDSNSSGNLRIAVVNNDNEFFSREYINDIQKNRTFKLSFVNAKTAKKQVIDQIVDCAIVIPKNFTKSVYINNVKKFKIVSIKGEEVTGFIKSTTDVFIENLQAISNVSNKNKSTFNKIYSKYKRSSIGLKVKITKDLSNSKQISSLGLGLLIMFMLIGSTFTANRIILEKKNRTYYRICCAPISELDYLIANIATNSIIILIQITGILIVINKVLNLNMAASTIALFLVLSAFGLVSIGFGLLIVAFSKTTKQVDSLSTLIVTPTCMLGGCFWPYECMPKFLQRFADFIPQKWALQAIIQLQYGKTFYEVSGIIVILLAFAVVFFSIAIYKFKINDDIRILV
jgi:ABC-2 type transport system permease protein